MSPPSSRASVMDVLVIICKLHDIFHLTNLFLFQIRTGTRKKRMVIEWQRKLWEQCDVCATWPQGQTSVYSLNLAENENISYNLFCCKKFHPMWQILQQMGGVRIFVLPKMTRESASKAAQFI